MTFALIRDGKIIDHTSRDTLRSLAGWPAGRTNARTSLVILELDPGEEARVGDRVSVTLAEVGVASIAPPRARRAVP